MNFKIIIAVYYFSPHHISMSVLIKTILSYGCNEFLHMIDVLQMYHSPTNNIILYITLSILTQYNINKI